MHKKSVDQFLMVPYKLILAARYADLVNVRIARFLRYDTRFYT